MYRIFIDRVEYENPNGWRDATTTIKRDRQNKGIVVTQDATLVFIGDAYNHLYTLFRTAGSKETVRVRVLKEQRGGYFELYKGTLFVTDIEFDKYSREAKTKIQDDSFYAKINNNRSIEVKLYAPRSKNDVSIPLAVPAVIQFFDYATGTYYPVSNGVANNLAHCRGFTVYEAFRFILDYISDGEVGFQSSLFGPGGRYEGLCLTNGYSIKGVQQSTNDEATFNQYLKGVSFDTLFKEVNKKLNIGFSIARGLAGKPVVRIEEDQFFYQNNRLFRQVDVDKIRMHSATEFLYSAIELGSTKILDVPSYSFPENVIWEGFSREQYTIQYKSNTDKILSCKSEWIISSNVITDAVEQSLATTALSDDEFTLIDCVLDPSTGYYQADHQNWISTAAPYYYNHRLRNAAVAANYSNVLPASIVNYSGAIDNGCSVKTSAATTYQYLPTVISPVALNNEQRDPQNNFSPTLFRYTAPQAGVYSFLARMLIEYGNVFTGNGQNVGGADLRVALRVYNVGATEISPLPDGYVLFNINQNANFHDPFVIGGNVTLTLNQGDYVICEVVTDGYYAPTFSVGTSVRINTNSLFECIAAFTGGAYQKTQFSNNPLLRAEYSYPFTDAEFKTILANPLGYIQYAMDGERARNAYIDTMKLKHEQYEADFTLSTSQKDL